MPLVNVAAAAAGGMAAAKKILPVNVYVAGKSVLHLKSLSAIADNARTEGVCFVFDPFIGRREGFKY
jgi:hypothetical protein